MKIAVMGAMVEEVDPFLQVSEHEPLLKYFKKHNDIEYAGNLYHEAKFRDLDIVLSYSKIGKVFSDEDLDMVSRTHLEARGRGE